ncbi:MAG TPA: GGDEF domain-containing protein, partial [Candidatus Acidoferrum sp.]|nr:GGDEF domain-containing protein [Candidatus Acidoferrum sp.]
MFRIGSKNTRVLVLIGVMAAASFGIGGGVYLITSVDSADLNASTTQLATLSTIAHELSLAVRDQESALDASLLSRSAAAERRFQEAVAAEKDTQERLAVAAVGQPRILSALAAMAAASLDWRARLAMPALAAVASNDTVAMNSYASGAADGHVAVTMAADAIDKEIILSGKDLGARAAAADFKTAVGVTVAFGFLAVAFAVALVAVRRFGHALEIDAREASVLNRFTEVTSFAVDDHEVAAANLAALTRLAKPDASVTHILNRSKDRAVPEASTGNAVAEILPLHALSRCAGIVRGAMYVSDDLSDDLSVHCPVYPAATGTLACLPLVSGESVGAVHLYWTRPNAVPLKARASIARITEHAALAIGNRRLLTALHGQANTDARTGLANSRAFDMSLEESLAARAGAEPLSVLMIDVDHFKDFNDRNGHPAGDVALRAFADVLRSCLRDGDLAARYGGEEFAVYLVGQDLGVGRTVAERIRARTESTIISLSPGMADRITVSIGLVNAPEQGLDRVTLLRLADEALYRAKSGGLNRVVA